VIDLLFVALDAAQEGVSMPEQLFLVHGSYCLKTCLSGRGHGGSYKRTNGKGYGHGDSLQYQYKGLRIEGAGCGDREANDGTGGGSGMLQGVYLTNQQEPFRGMFAIYDWGRGPDWYPPAGATALLVTPRDIVERR
jgi:hypothetical protein